MVSHFSHRWKSWGKLNRKQKKIFFYSLVYLNLTNFLLSLFRYQDLYNFLKDRIPLKERLPQDIAILQAIEMAEVVELAARRRLVNATCLRRSLVLWYLLRREGIDSNKVFLLGHSLGGGLVPEIASRDGKVAGVIVLAGNTRPLHELVLEQTEYIVLLDGEISEEEARKLEEIEKEVEAINNHQPGEDEIVLGVPARYWYALQERDAIKEALALSSPLLILQGERDYQVTVEDFGLWQEGLASKGNITFKLYPNLNHLFMAGEGKSTPSEYQRLGHVDEQVINDIAAWILKN